MIEFHHHYPYVCAVGLREPSATIETDDANVELVPGDPLEYRSQRFRPLAEGITVRPLQRIERRIVARRQRVTRQRGADARIGDRVPPERFEEVRSGHLLSELRSCENR